MKTDGGLSMVVAPMGGGKTLHEVRQGVKDMLAGKWWVTNIRLYDDALETIARHASRVTGHAGSAKIVRRLEDRYRYVEELDEALMHAVWPAKRKPGQWFARLSWDESLTELNSREWNGGRGKSADDRNTLFERMPMLRKNGVHAFLIVQHEELLDKNARRICNWYIRVENQREHARIMGRFRLSILPRLFIAYYYQGNKADKSSRELRASVKYRYRLGWYGDLYDTLGLYGVSADDAVHGRTIWLGAPEGVRGLHAVAGSPSHPLVALPLSSVTDVPELSESRNGAE